jgi:transcriptional regulator with XRE-family HTH domain
MLRGEIHVSEQPFKPHLSLVGDENQRLTRAQVAERLGVSVSTVRRYEGDKLHPTIGDDGVRTFAASDVERLARTLVAEQSPRARDKAIERAAELSRGDIAAAVFERLEQRHSLAEIVIALRLPPEDVRALYHAWLVGLCEGELRNQKEPMLPPLGTDAAYERRVSPVDLEALLGALPAGEATRISVARDSDIWEEDRAQYRYVVELGGFVVRGPIGIDAIANRYGEGEFRVTAYALDPPGLRWEVFARCAPAPPRAIDTTRGEAPPIGALAPPAANSATAAPAPAPAVTPSSLPISPDVPVTPEIERIAAGVRAQLATAKPARAAAPPSVSNPTPTSAPPSVSNPTPTSTSTNASASTSTDEAEQLAALEELRAAFRAASAPAPAASAATAKPKAPRARPMTDADVRRTMEDVAKRLPPVPAWAVRMLLEGMGSVELQFFRVLIEGVSGQADLLVGAFRSRELGAAMLGPIAAVVGEPVVSVIDRWESSEPWTPPTDLEARVQHALAERGAAGSRTAPKR